MMSSVKIFMIIFMSVLLFAANGLAETASTEDQQIELRLKALSTELRCLVCQNTTLSDSNAPLAEDLRNEIRELMRAGKTDEEVTTYLVDRYGDFVRYRPPMQANTALLWVGPFVMLLVGVFVLFRVLKKHAANQAQSSEDEVDIGEKNE